MTRTGRPISYDDIFEAWPLLEADFLDVYNIDLEEVFHRKSWRWFAALVDGLLACDSRIHRQFRDDPSEVVDEHDGGVNRWEAEP